MAFIYRHQEGSVICVTEAPGYLMSTQRGKPAEPGPMKNLGLMENLI